MCVELLIMKQRYFLDDLNTWGLIRSTNSKEVKKVNKNTSIYLYIYNIFETMETLTTITMTTISLCYLGCQYNLDEYNGNL